MPSAIIPNEPKQTERLPSRIALRTWPVRAGTRVPWTSQMPLITLSLSFLFALSRPRFLTRNRTG